jgi:hypothetical protein
MFKIENSTKALSITLLTMFVTGTAMNAVAAEHPRRHQVNQRLHRQDKRINKEVREGDISKQRARQLHRKDRQIRNEERSMASQNGGHVTRQEQRTLNQQENRVSRQIGK